MLRHGAIAVVLIFAFGTHAGAIEIGEPIDGFALPDIHGRDRSLAEFADKPIVVVAFLGTECPLARLYGPRLQQLSQSYASPLAVAARLDDDELIRLLRLQLS